MRQYLNNIEYAFFLLGFLLTVIKTSLFFRGIPGHKSLPDWFHFDSYERVNARSSSIRRSMNMQNRFSLFIVFAVLVAVMAHIVKRYLIL